MAIEREIAKKRQQRDIPLTASSKGKFWKPYKRAFEGLEVAMLLSGPR